MGGVTEVYLRGAGSFWLAWYTECPVGHVGGQDVGGADEIRMRLDVRDS